MISNNVRRFRLFCAAVLIGGEAAFIGGCAREGARAGAPETIAPAYLAFARGRVDVKGGLVPIATSCSGQIKEVRVEEGDEVRAGQLLAVIDDRQARLGLAVDTAALAEANAALLPIQVRLAGAQREAARLQPLLPTDAVAAAENEKAKDLVASLQAEIAVATAAVATAEARVQAGQFDVDNHEIRAPVDGRMVKRTVIPGETVGALTPIPLFLLEPHAPLIVRADLDERFVDQVASGMAAEVVVNNDKERVLPARIVRVGEIFGAKPPTGEPGERADLRTVECIVALQDSSLRIGQRVLVRVLVKP